MDEDNALKDNSHLSKDHMLLALDFSATRK